MMDLEINTKTNSCSISFQTVLRDPLPDELLHGGGVPLEERFKTTNTITFDQKHVGGPYGNDDPVYKKPPAHWKVNYISDFHEKVTAILS